MKFISFEEFTRAEAQEIFNNLDPLVSESLLIFLLKRIIPGADFEMLEQKEGEDKNTYQRLKMFNKPSIAQFVEEFDSFKLELQAELTAFYDDLDLFNDLKVRAQALLDNEALPFVIKRAGQDIPNPAAKLKELVKDRNETIIAAIEARIAQGEADLQALKDESTNRNQAKQNLKTFLDSNTPATANQVEFLRLLFLYLKGRI